MAEGRNHWREHRTDELLCGARELRRKSTKAEAVLWSCLRDRQLCGYKFRRQHALGSVVLDFYCATARLAVEVDGGVHKEPSAREKDGLRTVWLGERGIGVLRVTNEEVLHDPDSTLRRILEALAAGETHTPGPETTLATDHDKTLTPGPSPASGRGEEEDGEAARGEGPECGS